jgi:hypothetical protein
MMSAAQFRLIHDVYTPHAIADSIAVFSHLCTASADNRGDHSILVIEGADEMLQQEMLNYILALSVPQLLA